jgi:OmcA/MtrC family decaheme c-type cytochrome
MKALWNGMATGTGAGTLTYDSATGTFTATLTGVAIPTTAKMVTAGIGYTYDLLSAAPLVQTNIKSRMFPDYNPATKVGGLMVVAPNVWRVATGSTSRRMLVENSRCNTCHEKIGVFGKKVFHGAQRNDAQTCNFCHNPVTASSGWSANSSTFIHGIHANAGLSSKRTVPYSWEFNGFAKVGYPGAISKCEACHLPDVVNYGAIYTRTGSSDQTPISTGNAAALATFQDNMLYSSVAYGTLSNVLPTVLSPYVTAGVAYGAKAPTFQAATGKMDSQPDNLVSSPIAAACFSCHDTAKAQTHIVDIGNGSLYQPRATALLRKETCLSCHGAGKVADAQVVHQ